MHDLDPRLPVGRLATTHPQSIQVFEAHGIDYCCGGARTLLEVCSARGLDVDAMLAEVRVRPAPPAPPIDFNTAPLDAIVDHIVARYHRPLERELARLGALLQTVAGVHIEQTERFENLVEAFSALRQQLEPHLGKEEEVLFVWIRSGRGEAGATAAKVLAEEHESIGAILARIRTLTDGFVAPDDACPTWCALWDGLSALERDLREHIHLENNVLFPRALA